MAYSYSGRGRPQGALARIRALPEELETAAAAHGRECSRIRADAERLADGAGSPWPEELRAISAAAAANEPVQCSVCDAVQTDPLGAWLAAVDGLFRRRVVAYRRSATRLIAGAHAERQRAIKEAADADSLVAPIGYVTRDPDGLPVGYGETMHEAARDAMERGHTGPASAVPATPALYEAARDTLGGE